MFEISTKPVSEPLTVSECKTHLRVDHSDEDAQITMYLQSAREEAERMTNVALMPQTVKQYYDCFPGGCFELARTPVASVTSVKYVDTAGTTQTLVKDTDYEVDKISKPARINPINSWPATKSKVNAVTIEFVAGYDDADAVPAEFKTLLLLMVGQKYEVRENHVDRYPTRVNTLISKLKIMM